MIYNIKVNHFKKLKKPSKFFKNQVKRKDFIMKTKKTQKKMVINIYQCYA